MVDREWEREVLKIRACPIPANIQLRNVFLLTEKTPHIRPKYGGIYGIPYAKPHPDYDFLLDYNAERNERVLYWRKKETHQERSKPMATKEQIEAAYKEFISRTKLECATNTVIAPLPDAVLVVYQALTELRKACHDACSCRRGTTMCFVACQASDAIPAINTALDALKPFLGEDK